MLQIFRAANRLELRELRLRADDRYEEHPPPATLSSGEICVLYPNGSLFFAGAQVLESQLPDPDGAERPVVILVLRGRKEVGSTFIGVIDRYAHQLHRRGGRLMLAGVSERVRWQLERTGLLRKLGPENVFPSTTVIGEALAQARNAAQAWLAAAQATPEGNGESPDATP